MTAADASPWMYRALAALMVFVGVGALPAGLLLIDDPTGVGLGLELAALQRGPFQDYLVPGWVLLVVNGFGSLLAGWLAVRRWRFSGLVGVGLGVFLMAWIGIQVAVMGLFLVPPFQPVFFAVGLAEVVLGVQLTRAQLR